MKLFHVKELTNGLKSVTLPTQLSENKGKCIVYKKHLWENAENQQYQLADLFAGGTKCIIIKY
jgi:hypothetical protein